MTIRRPMIFVDSGAWYAAVMPSDPNHVAARDWLSANQEQVITTDYVVDETLTFLKARGHSIRAFTLGGELIEGRHTTVHFLSEAEVLAAWQVFQRFRDKEWSFTNCASKVVIEKLGLTKAIAFDLNFRQFGSIQVVP